MRAALTQLLSLQLQFQTRPPTTLCRTLFLLLFLHSGRGFLQGLTAALSHPTCIIGLQAEGLGFAVANSCS